MKLHDYQTYAKNFILEHPACGVFLDMGLGKTIICLMALWELILDYFDIGKVLVVAPLRVANSTWPNEIKKWSEDLQGLSFSVVTGTVKERREALARPAFLYITNRENLVWIIENGYFNFDMVVIDELSSFKSGKTKRFKAMKGVRSKVKRIVGLTGTPAPNGLEDLWSQVYLLDGGIRLGRFITGYREKYFLPDKRNREVIFSYRPRNGAEDAIYEKISDICISMKAVDHLDMPEVIVNDEIVTMDDIEKKLYEQLKSDLIIPLEGGDIDAQSAVGLSNKLRQMASGAVYNENGNVVHIHDKKLDALSEIVEAAVGRPVLVAYYYKHDRDRLLERFPEALSIDKPEDIDKWNTGEVPIAIIHPMSAGHGLNIQDGGCHLVWFSLPNFSLEAYQQCNARLYRQGQKHTVTIQHLITEGTIDEDVLAALKKKDCGQEALLAAVKARIGG